MMRWLSSWPVLAQVTALIAISVAVALSLGFVLLVLQPPPPQEAISPADVINTITAPEEVGSSPSLRREIVDMPPISPTRRGDLSSLLIAAGIAERLQVPVEWVRVAPLQAAEAQSEQPVMIIPGGNRPVGSSASQVQVGGGRVLAQPRLSGLLLSPQMRFPPFETAVRRHDGRWIYVKPAREWLSPWHVRILLAFLATLALLLPIALIAARRMTRPMRRLAEAADGFALDQGPAEAALEGPAELQRAAIALNRMKSRIRRHVDERTTMLAAIAHDLRTPLTGLRLRAENAPASDRTRMISDISRMERMITQILAFVRGEQKPTPPPRTNLGDVVSAYVRDRAATGEPLILKAPPSSPALLVSIDPDDLVRILANLIDNALRYGGGSEVVIEVRSGGDRAIITISDQGPGVPESEAEQIFEPFYRLENSRSGETGGTGLGLAIVRAITRRVGGEVTLSNRSPRGAVATLILPLMKD